LDKVHKICKQTESMGKPGKPDNIFYRIKLNY
jgi:hypothetical protein